MLEKQIEGDREKGRETDRELPLEQCQHPFKEYELDCVNNEMKISAKKNLFWGMFGIFLF